MAAGVHFRRGPAPWVGVESGEAHAVRNLHIHAFRTARYIERRDLQALPRTFPRPQASTSQVALETSALLPSLSTTDL
jgi:hypothetical protein